MWNWKLIYEDSDITAYCDAENIVSSQADEEGMFSSVDCYQPLSGRTAVWVTFFIKNRDITRQYIDYLKKEGVLSKGYKDFNNILCLIEVDPDKKTYRAIPALDYDKEGRELGVSKLITDKGVSFIKGLKGDWSYIKSRNTNKTIPAIFKFLYGQGGS